MGTDESKAVKKGEYQLSEKSSVAPLPDSSTTFRITGKSDRRKEEGMTEMLLEAKTLKSRDEWLHAFDRVIQGRPIIESAMDTLYDETSIILKESEELCETMCIMCQLS